MQRCDIIYCEDLYDEDSQSADMVKNQRRARRISDAVWRAFLTVLVVIKAAYAVKLAGDMPPASTSQTCSSCGREMWKGPSTRWHRCPCGDCGVSLRREENAASKMLARGKQEATCGRADRADVNVARWGRRSLSSPCPLAWGACY